MLRTICLLVIFAGALLPLNARGSDMIVFRDDVGQLWLQIMGRIDEGDDIKLKDTLIGAIHRGEQIENVLLYSSGGRLSPAMKIGRYIRTMRLTTVVPQLVPLVQRQICHIHDVTGRTAMVDYDAREHRGDARCTCAGACFLIWAAGATRQGDAVRIHRLSAHGDEDAGTPAAVETSSQRDVEDYLRDMGIPGATIDRMSGIGADRIEYLNRDEGAALTSKTALPLLQELFAARCHDHAASSPAALACERAVVRELYWQGADRLLRQPD
jgi:hypothetical protein